MCMQTIKEKLQNNRYNNGEECLDDFRLMFNNCYTYNKVSVKMWISTVTNTVFKIQFILYAMELSYALKCSRCITI